MRYEVLFTDIKINGHHINTKVAAEFWHWLCLKFLYTQYIMRKCQTDIYIFTAKDSQLFQLDSTIVCNTNTIIRITTITIGQTWTADHMSNLKSRTFVLQQFKVSFGSAQSLNNHFILFSNGRRFRQPQLCHNTPALRHKFLVNLQCVEYVNT